MSRNIYRTQSAGVEKPGIIMHHSKTQYISLKALTNELKFIDLRSIFATSYRQKTKTQHRVERTNLCWNNLKLLNKKSLDSLLN